jgi:hypothetical protein
VEAAEPLDKDRVGDKGAAGGSRRSRSLLHHHLFYPVSASVFFWSGSAFIKILGIRLLFDNADQGPGVPANNIACKQSKKRRYFIHKELKKVGGSLSKAGVSETKP